MTKKQSKKRRDLRIMWQSNGPHVNSGYGVFTREWALRTKADGWPIAISAFNGLESAMLDWNGIPMYPRVADAYGSDALYLHSLDFKADVVFTMQDTPTLDTSYLSRIPHWIPYTPVHYTPTEPMVLDRLKFAYKIITFAEYGRKGLEDSGFSSTLIKEGLDTTQFRPVDAREKQEMRKALGVPDDIFLFGMIGANKEVPARKGFQEALDAFAKFLEKRPNAYLYIHTLEPPIGKFPIKYYAKHLGIENNVFVPNNYNALFKSSHEIINKLLNTFDCLLQPSRTEGFGLPIIEAQAVGVPVIVTDFSAMPELITKDTGLTVKVADYEFSSQWGYMAQPDVNDLAKQMEVMYDKLQDREEKQRIAKIAREHVLQNFNLDTIFKEQWIPLLEELQEEILKKDA